MRPLATLHVLCYTVCSMNSSKIATKKKSLSHTVKTAGIVFFCILLNYFGKELSVVAHLPFWLDSYGTVLASYILGPVSGAITGIAFNLSYGFKHALSIPYALTNAAIGIVTGMCARRGYFNSMFGTLSTSGIVALTASLISFPLNVFLGEGRTGNLWGDEVISFLNELGFPYIIAAGTGELYVEFLDKTIVLLLLYLFVVIYRRVRLQKSAGIKKETKTIIALCTLFLAAQTFLVPKVYAIQGNGYNAYVQTIYSSNNGLSCGEANDVVQTSDGILWIGTYAGLYRYNGSDFRLMNEYDSVRNVSCLFVDNEGRLWIGTNDNGISIAIGERIFERIDESLGLPSNSIRSITQNADGDFYVGTTSSLAVVSLDAGIQVKKIFSDITYCVSSSSNSDGFSAVVTNDGKLFLLKDKEHLDYVTAQDEQNDFFKTCFFSSSGLLYVGTALGNITVFSVQNNALVLKTTFPAHGLSQINRLYEHPNEIFFVCSDNGVGTFDGETYHFDRIDTGTFNNSIDNMTSDYQGNLWFTSSRLGLLRLSYSTFTDLYGELGLVKKVVNTTALYKDLLYVGTDTGLDIIDVPRKKMVQNDLSLRLKNVRIRCIISDSQNNLWLCTYGQGLWCLKDDGSILTFDAQHNIGPRVRACLELKNKDIAVASDIGFTILSGFSAKEVFKYDSDLLSAQILSIMQMPDDTILLGTDGDGIAIISKDKTISWLSREDGLSAGVVMRTVLDKKNKGAFVVTSNGLCYINSEYKIRLLQTFPYFNNYDIFVSPRKEIFVPGSAGVYVLSLDEALSVETSEPDYELLDAKRGLSSALTANSWSCIDSEYNIYLCCNTGVFMVNMQDYLPEQRTYRMGVSSIKLDGENFPIQRANTFTIPRTVKRIEIFPEVINYMPEDPSVQYYLEGSDLNKTVLLQKDMSGITYTNLSAGRYVFHLAILDASRKTILEETTFTLIKEKAMHDNKWFSAYIIFVAMLFVAWLTWFIVRSQVQATLAFQKRELELSQRQVQMGNETILAIAKTVDAKDDNTSQHSQRVSEYSVKIAQELGFSESETENIRKAALLHDIGKIGIPDNILKKAGKLSEEEYTIMKSHTTKGAEILKDFTLVEHVVDGALYHHERYDGTGYPSGLKGETIPLYGRIIGVADAFDAMTANRVYRKKLHFATVINEMKMGSGTQFDPHILDVFIHLIESGKINVQELYKTGDTK